MVSGQVRPPSLGSRSVVPLQKVDERLQKVVCSQQTFRLVPTLCSRPGDTEEDTEEDTDEE